jgi:hypothetical protein
MTSVGFGDKAGDRPVKELPTPTAGAWMKKPFGGRGKPASSSSKSTYVSK